MAKTSPDSVRRIRIFISSPGDVPKEREAARDVVRRLGKDSALRDHLSLDAILWDDPEARTTMLATLTPQGNVNESARPSDCQVVVVVLWSRMGTPLESPRKADGSQYRSGTEWEYEDACRDANAEGRKVLVYRCTRDPQVSLRDPKFAEKRQQLDLVDEFFGRFEGSGGGFLGSCVSYESVEEFEKLLEQNLRDVLPAFIQKRRRATRRSSPPRGTAAASPAATLIVPDAYREWLKQETGSLELLGLGGAQGRSLFLSSVYVPLVTTAGDKDRRIELGERWDRPSLLLRMLGEQSLYVPGGPGSGKSTFCRWVAWLASSGSVPAAEVESPEGFVEEFPVSFAEKLPLLVPLRELWEQLPIRREGSTLSATDLLSLLRTWLRDRTQTARDIDLKAFIENGRALVLFDGVDEVPTSHPKSADGNPRQLLLSGLAQAVRTWRQAGNIVLVTSRPYGLSQEETQRIGLDVAPIGDLPRELQTVLARRWFRIQKQDAEKGDANANELMRDVGERDWLHPLAANPLMLTAMCAIYSDGGKLPQDRHQLYDRIVDSVLTKRYDDAKRRARARFELCAIAHAMHTGDALGQPYSEPLAEATFDEAELALKKDKPAGSTAEAILGPREAREDLLVRSGLLTQRGDHTIAFYHLSIQEFLAAERVFELQLDELQSVFEKRAASPNWRNTLAFLFGRYLAAFTVPSRPIALLNRLIEEISDDVVGLRLVAGDCAEMLLAKGYAPGETQLTSLRESLFHSMRERTQVIDRCEAGTVLGKIGDPRFNPTAWYLPVDTDAPLGFLRVNAGPFLMGSDKQRDPVASGQEQPQHSVDLPEFYIARYPVTVAQFKAFVEASGFQPGDRDCLRGVANHPVVRVSWHEALKYCEWLTEKMGKWADAPPSVKPWLDATLKRDRGWRVTLPSEAEWEKAARGTDGRVYPWGDMFEASRANTWESEIQRTTTVGAFPAGWSPFGALDMSGNVWEWTRSLWGPDPGKPEFAYPYRPDDAAREDVSAPDSILRVVRGGSWVSDDRNARAANRLRNGPGNRNDNIGFRVVVSCLRT